MSSRLKIPAPQVVVDDKYLERYSRLVEEGKKSAKLAAKSRSLSDLETEITRSRETLQVVKNQIAEAKEEVERKKSLGAQIINVAEQKAAKVLSDAIDTRAALDKQAAEKRAKLLSQADAILEGTKLGEKRIKERGDKFVKREKALEEAENRLQDALQDLSVREAELRVERDKYKHDVATLGKKEQAIAEKWKEVDETLEGLKLRESEIAKKEKDAKATLEKGKRDLQHANQQALNLQNESSRIEARLLELKNLEVRLENSSREFNAKDRLLKARELRVIEREKNCEIRESQIRARR